jgi:DnaD/phage-associated family protein
MISSDIVEDEFFISLNGVGRIMWFGLIARCADDQGRMQDNSTLIKSQVFPADDIDHMEVEAQLIEYEKCGKIFRYKDGNKKLIQILNWWKYQTPSWAGKSRYAPPQGWTDREKYHGSNGAGIITNNWVMKGGFPGDTIPVTNQDTNPVTNPVTKHIDDVNVNVNGEDKVAAAATVFSYYQSNIGPLNKHLSDVIGEAIDRYPVEWIIKAIDLAVEANARKWAYISAILQRWEVDGFDAGKRNGKTKETMDPRNNPVEDY